jgi:hypothetical protein
MRHFSTRDAPRSLIQHLNLVTYAGFAHHLLSSIFISLRPLYSHTITINREHSSVQSGEKAWSQHSFEISCGHYLGDDVRSLRRRWWAVTLLDSKVLGANGGRIRSLGLRIKSEEKGGAYSSTNEFEIDEESTKTT